MPAAKPVSPVSRPAWARRPRRFRTIPGCLTAVVLLSAALAGVPVATAAPTAPSAPQPPGSPPTSALAWVAKVIYPTLARSAPDSTRADALFAVPPVSVWGTPTKLLVLGSRLDSAGHPWVLVRLDYRPNGYAAWIDADDAVLFTDSWRISILRARHEVLVYRAHRLMRTFAAVVGKPSTPTPAGLFAVAAELRQPDPGEFEGSWVLPLTAHSEVLTHFAGGDGQIALHGRGGASLADPLGSALSHGCARLANEAIDWIAANVPVGTPVRVR
jgi:L,D-transpeptidase-like protein